MRRDAVHFRPPGKRKGPLHERYAARRRRPHGRRQQPLPRGELHRPQGGLTAATRSGPSHRRARPRARAALDRADPAHVAGRAGARVGADRGEDAAGSDRQVPRGRRPRGRGDDRGSPRDPALRSVAHRRARHRVRAEDHHLSPMASRLRFAFVALCLGLSACPAARRARVPEGAVLLYDVAFAAPEQALNEEVKVVEPQTAQQFPSKIPSAIFFGHPTVIAKLCGLEQQPVQLAVAHATEGLEGLEFLLDQRYGRYHVELDLCVQQIDPPPLPSQAVQVAVFLDVAEAYALGFMSGGVLAIVDPTLHPETQATPPPVGTFELRKPVHLSFDVDLEKQTWRIAVDGKTVYDAALEA